MLHINSPTQKEKLATRPEIITEKDTPSIPTETSTRESMSMAKEQATENICMLTETAMKEPSSATKSMVLVDS